MDAPAWSLSKHDLIKLLASSRHSLLPHSITKSIATLGANGDANGPHRGPGFQEIPKVAR